MCPTSCGEVCDDASAQETLDEIIKKAKDFTRLVETSLPVNKPRRVTERPRREPLPRGILSAHEEARAEAQAAHLKLLASAEPILREFREEMLGYIPDGLKRTQRGRLLTEKEAFTFVTSPVLRCYPRWQCELLNIPLVGHNAEFIEGEDGDTATPMPNNRLRRRVVLQVDGKRCSAQWLTKGNKKPPSVIYDAAPPGVEPVDRKRYFVRESSVIDKLRRLADKFVEGYGWEQAPTLRFILTGDAPPIHPIQGETTKWRTSTGSVDLEEITLVVKPWVSEEMLIKMYREGQRRMHVEQSASQQRTKLRNIRIYRYVTEQTSVTGKRPLWQKLMESWNAQCPAGDRIGHRPNFIRAYRSGEKGVWM